MSIPERWKGCYHYERLVAAESFSDEEMDAMVADEMRSYRMHIDHKPGGADGKLDWETPDALFDWVERRFPIAFDLAADSMNAKVSDYFDAEDDALDSEWPRKMCWLNPPYGSSMLRWAQKAVAESSLGTSVVLLVPARVDTRWWHYLAPKCKEVILLKGRVRFRGASGPAPFPSAILYLTDGNGPPRLIHADPRAT